MVPSYPVNENEQVAFLPIDPGLGSLVYSKYYESFPTSAVSHKKL